MVAKPYPSPANSSHLPRDGSMSFQKCLVAIVGRPNVGKSTLFNRIVGKRVAVVEKSAGVTRDRHYAQTVWREQEFILVDTGGFDPSPKTSLSAQIQGQLQLAVDEAEAIIFVVDSKEGLTPWDFEIASRLRKAEKAVLVGVNKVDFPGHEERMYECYQLGFGEIFPLSAEHNEGISPLLDRLVERVPKVEKEEEEPKKTIRVAVIGRPNVGKSSLVNYLLGKDRVIVDSTPGTTMDAIDTLVERNGQRYLFIDTAGIRRKGKVSLRLEKTSVIMALRGIERADIVLVLLDATQGITDQDAVIAGYAYEANKGVILVLNKWDLVSSTRRFREDQLLLVRDRLKYVSYAPVLFLSALTGEGVGRIFPTLRHLAEEYHKKVTTSVLNKVLQETVEKHPAIREGRSLKFYYITQVGVAPPTFLCFVSDPQAIHFSYQRYLRNEFRRRLDFGGAPIRLRFRLRRPPRTS